MLVVYSMLMNNVCSFFSSAPKSTHLFVRHCQIDLFQLTENCMQTLDGSEAFVKNAD